MTSPVFLSERRSVTSAPSFSMQFFTYCLAGRSTSTVTGNRNSSLSFIFPSSARRIYASAIAAMIFSLVWIPPQLFSAFSSRSTSSQPSNAISIREVISRGCTGIPYPTHRSIVSWDGVTARICFSPPAISRIRRATVEPPPSPTVILSCIISYALFAHFCFILILLLFHRFYPRQFIPPSL